MSEYAKISSEMLLKYHAAAAMLADLGDEIECGETFEYGYGLAVGIENELRARNHPNFR